MAALDELMSSLPIGDIAKKLGVDEATATQAVEQALPALLAGMGANAQDQAGAASLQKAVSKHDPALVEGGVNLADVDEEDGKKIVKNVFGQNTDQVVQALDQKQGGGAGDLIGKLLPILAPIVLSFLAQQFTKKSTGGESQGGGIGDLLGGLLGGGFGGGAQAQGGGLGDLLGGLFGGGSGGGSQAQGGGLGDLLGGLGGLLGGGKR
ncbi:DUF937 domain-containing protein [Agromyces mediolanus]|uniref:DUF937 domain-containing protein n=1 Tax=Agromyces mediolanus TaxID=41986 RepID=UPI00203B4313|nr:DUF937 domain-containing protein [Agromyces mediolanus]MCM3657876.1 DUF937 domain-containing protein [Agromyces mediolanus]